MVLLVLGTLVFYTHVLRCNKHMLKKSSDHNTAFPAGITAGATWDKDLLYRRGVAIGEEFRGKGVSEYARVALDQDTS